MRRRKNPPSISSLKARLDSVFSRYIRKTYSKRGKCLCFTCGKEMLIKEAQCGHFVSRSYTATRWDERNCRPQCVGCNLFGGGKPLDFEEHLKKDIGESEVEDLKNKRHQIVKLIPGELQKLIDFYGK